MRDSEHQYFTSIHQSFTTCWQEVPSRGCLQVSFQNQTHQYFMVGRGSCYSGTLSLAQASCSSLLQAALGATTGGTHQTTLALPVCESLNLNAMQQEQGRTCRGGLLQRETRAGLPVSLAPSRTALSALQPEHHPLPDLRAQQWQELKTD